MLGILLIMFFFISALALNVLLEILFLRTIVTTIDWDKLIALFMFPYEDIGDANEFGDFSSLNIFPFRWIRKVAREFESQWQPNSFVHLIN